MNKGKREGKGTERKENRKVREKGRIKKMGFWELMERKLYTPPHYLFMRILALFILCLFFVQVILFVSIIVLLL